MASLLPGSCAPALIRSQCPRPAILAWRAARRSASTSTETSSCSSDIPPTSIPTSAPSPPAEDALSALEQSPRHNDPPGSREYRPSRRFIGRVVSAGLMSKTVKVSRPSQEWNNYLRKYYKTTLSTLIHDPASSLRTGDVVAYTRLPTAPRSERVSHVVTEILVPFGSEIGARPPVPGLAELERERAAKRAEKEARRELRRRAEAGDEAARKEVDSKGLGVREVKKGRGRGGTVRRVLERDFRR